jgi:hypothetical protein
LLRVCKYWQGSRDTKNTEKFSPPHVRSLAQDKASYQREAILWKGSGGPMSPSGQKQTSALQKAMSAL